MTEQWQELKETITELRDNDGTASQQEVCKFLVNLMNVLEKQMQEPCEDAISRQVVLAIAGDSVLDLGDYEDCEDFLSQIRELPPVTPQPKTGHWERRVVEDDSPLFRVRFYCSSCGEWNSYGESEYCPNCGADMRGEE